MGHLTMMALIVLVCIGIPSSVYGANIGHILVGDAGSTHTEILLYEWSTPSLRHTAETVLPCCQKQLMACSHIGALGVTVNGVQEHVTDCLAEAQEVLHNRTGSDEAFHLTPFYLRATAGLRVLNMTSPATVADTIDAVVNATADTSLLNHGDDDVAGIMSGADEGAFGWVAANFLEGRLEETLQASKISRRAVQELSDTVTALDMGGASTQLTFVPAQGVVVHEQDRVNLDLYGHSIPLYSHSYLCFGADRTTRRRQALLLSSAGNCTNPIQDPCLPEGYTQQITPDEINIMKADRCFDGFIDDDFPTSMTCSLTGASSFDSCNNSFAEIFSSNSAADTPRVGDLAAGLARQPAVPSGPIHLFSNFYHTINFLFQNTSASCGVVCLKSLRDVLMRTKDICNQTLPNLRRQHTDVDDKYIPTYCQTAMYELNLLLHYGIDFERNLSFVKSVNGTSVNWALGFALNQTTSLPSSPVTSLAPDMSSTSSSATNAPSLPPTISPTPAHGSSVPDEIWIGFGTCAGVIALVFLAYFGGCCCRPKKENDFVALTDLTGLEEDDNLIVPEMMGVDVEADALHADQFADFRSSVYEDTLDEL